MSPNRRNIKSLGEVALRVTDLETMQEFYEHVVRLEVMRRLPEAVFFRISPDYGGHTQILALFDRSRTPGYQSVSQGRTPLDHLALTIDLNDYEFEKQRLENLGLEVIAKEQVGFSWRSLFFDDPEGNTVEFVCYDERVP